MHLGFKRAVGRDQRCSLTGNETWASFQRVTEILPANLVVFDVSSAEKIPSAEIQTPRGQKFLFSFLFFLVVVNQTIFNF